MTSIATVAIIGYLLGSIPFGLLLTRAAGLGDVRSIGSGNIGATNVLRTGNKGLAALTLLLDMLKGTAAVLVGFWVATSVVSPFSGPPTGQAGLEALAEGLVRAQNFIIGHGLAAGVSAFMGHVFPVWLGFKGGKGVATYIGVLVGFAWPTALIFAVAWLATAYLTKYSSLSALVATVVVFLFLLATSGPLVVAAAALMSALMFWTHRENIRRLVAGTESRIGAKG